MTVPIIIGGEECGTLEMRRDGAFTLFTARCALRPGLLRLYVFGQGGRGYLGVLQPQNGALYLRRRLSRAAMQSFPAKIEYAGVEEKSAEKAPVRTAEAAALLKTAAPENAASLLKNASPEKASNRNEKAAALLKAGPGGWIKRADGSLVRTEGEHMLLALPCALRRKVPGVDLREIEGRTYLVFQT